MSNAGTALMGIGRGEGKTKAEDAAAAAISSPLLDEPIDKAKGIVFNIVGGNDMSLQEVGTTDNGALVFLVLFAETKTIFRTVLGQGGLRRPVVEVWFLPKSGASIATLFEKPRTDYHLQTGVDRPVRMMPCVPLPFQRESGAI